MLLPDTSWHFPAGFKTGILYPAVQNSGSNFWAKWVRKPRDALTSGVFRLDKAPTLITAGWSAGDSTEPRGGPSFPAAAKISLWWDAANWSIDWEMAGKFKSLPPIEKTTMGQGRVAVRLRALRRDAVEMSEG